jgi:hypothetical protein
LYQNGVIAVSRGATLAWRSRGRDHNVPPAGPSESALHETLTDTAHGNVLTDQQSRFAISHFLNRPSKVSISTSGRRWKKQTQPSIWTCASHQSATTSKLDQVNLNRLVKLFHEKCGENRRIPDSFLPTSQTHPPSK